MSGGRWDGGRTNSAAVPLAIDFVNKDPSLLGYKIAFIWRDSQCSAGKALAAMSELLDAGVDVFIGPGCSVACEPTQLLASNRNILQVQKAPQRISTFFEAGQAILIVVQWALLYKFRSL